MKIDPKLFSFHHSHYESFEDFREHMLDYCAGDQSSDIIDSVDYSDDFGPSHVSSARRRQYGWKCKWKNENTNAITRFLTKNLGRSWDSIWSEICASNDNRSFQGYEFRHIFTWMVAQDIFMYEGKPYQPSYARKGYDWRDHPHTGFYVNPQTGVLAKGEPRRYSRPETPVTSIHHQHGNTWFKLEVLKDRNTECGCVHFKIPSLLEEDKKGYYRRYDDRPAVCVHGHEPTERPIWYVYTFSWRSPDEVYRVIHHYDSEAAKWGLKSGEIHTIYYRDVPNILAKPTIQRKKVASKKELKLINEYLESGGENQPSPEPRDTHYSRWGVCYNKS